MLVGIDVLLALIVGGLLFLEYIKVILLPVTVPLGVWFAYHHWGTKAGHYIAAIIVLSLLVLGCLLGILLKKSKHKK